MSPRHRAASDPSSPSSSSPHRLPSSTALPAFSPAGENEPLGIGLAPETEMTYDTSLSSSGGPSLTRSFLSALSAEQGPPPRPSKFLHTGSSGHSGHSGHSGQSGQSGYTTVVPPQHGMSGSYLPSHHGHGHGHGHGYSHGHGHGHGHVPRRRIPSATPSTTSVSEGEEEDIQEDTAAGMDPEEVRDWLEKGKGKGKGKGTGRRVDLVKGKGKGKGRMMEDQEFDVDMDMDMDMDESGVRPGKALELPAEILSQVLRLLSEPHDVLSALLVSRDWCLSAFPLLWQRPSLGSARQLASFVRVLSTPPDRLSLPYSNQVRRINLVSMADTLTDNLFVGLEACHRNERLTLTGATGLSSLALRRVISGMPDLVAIDLSNASGVDDAVVKRIAEKCPRLQGLNLTGCKMVGDEGIRAIAASLKLLRRIKLEGCHRLTDMSLIALARSCPLLLEMDLAQVQQLSNATVYGIFLNTTHLRELKLNGHNYLTDSAFPNLADLRDALDDELVDSAGRYADIIATLTHAEVGSVPSSRTVSTASTSNLENDGNNGNGDNEGNEGIPGYLPSRRKSFGRRDLVIRPPKPELLRPVIDVFEHLRIVDLTSCSAIGDRAVDNLVTNAPKLRSLTLNKCSNLTDRTVESVCRLGKHLHYLHLGHVSAITDAAVTKLARTCTRLRYIDLACCPLLTDLSVFELAANLPKLRRIGLVKVTNLTDEGIYALVERHSSLERIHLSYCDQVSVRAITFLLNRLMRLTHLSLTGVTAFKTPELQSFCRPTPPDFNEHQQASFCVYSGQGVASLRDYLNAQLAANTTPGSDDASTRRGSGSSASSITIPGITGSPPHTSSSLPGPSTHVAHDFSRSSFPGYASRGQARAQPQSRGGAEPGIGWSSAYSSSSSNPNANANVNARGEAVVFRRGSMPYLRDRDRERDASPRGGRGMAMPPLPPPSTILGSAFAGTLPNFLNPTVQPVRGGGLSGSGSGSGSTAGASGFGTSRQRDRDRDRDRERDRERPVGPRAQGGSGSTGTGTGTGVIPPDPDTTPQIGGWGGIWGSTDTYSARPSGQQSQQSQQSQRSQHFLSAGGPSLRESLVGDSDWSEVRRGSTGSVQSPVSDASGAGASGQRPRARTRGESVSSGLRWVAGMVGWQQAQADDEGS